MGHSVLALALVVGLVLSIIPATAMGSTAVQPVEPTETAVEDRSMQQTAIDGVAPHGTTRVTVDCTLGDATIQKGGSAYLGP